MLCTDLSGDPAPSISRVVDKTEIEVEILFSKAAAESVELEPEHLARGQIHVVAVTKENRDIETIGLGKIMSAGTLILASGTRGKRKIMKRQLLNNKWKKNINSRRKVHFFL